jgi:multiple sugar transport system ATP-binding protein
MTAKLEITGLVKRFGTATAVAGIDLTLATGEFLSLLGPSGCGKSTTLALLAGFLEPDEGSILIDGQPVRGLPPQRRKIGLVFQDYAVFTRLTVAENLAFGLRSQGMGSAERRREVAQMAERLDLAGLLRLRGSALNMSEMQRVALARVLITRPALLLLDEPMSNLDASIRAALRGELKKIQRELGQTVLYVTHDQIEAMTMSDRIAVMKDGRLLQAASPLDIYRRPADRFVAEFIGDPPINVIPCRVELEAGQALVTTACHAGLRLGPLAARPGECLLAVRPHGFRPARQPAPGRSVNPVRFVENLGAEHVLHVQYGEELVRVLAPPGFAAAGEDVHLELGGAAAHLIEQATGRIVASGREESHGAA